MDLRQEEMLGRFTSMEQGSWTTVYEDWHEQNGNGGIYCAFAPTAMRTRILKSPSWDVSMSDFRPGFSQHRENGEIVTRYFRSSTEDGIEPLVLCREYHGAVPSTRELAEHFRLYHNLYWDELSAQFTQPLDDGTSLAAVKLTANKIAVRTKLLRQFQAAQGYDLILYLDSVCMGEKEDALPEAFDLTTDTARISLHPGDRVGTGKFTRLLGTRVVPPPSFEKRGIWPFEEEDSHFPEFIIATDSDGDEIRYSCNLDSLSNYFGANPDAPHYLTPVYFLREVLQKYYEKPELYTVSDGYLSCASLWGLRLDNSAQDYVVVFLGDLGRDLPRQERDYWRSFNVTEDGPPSETLIRRAFLGQPAEPTAEDLLVRSNYLTFRRTWEDVYGWELFRKPEEADAGLLQRLRLPLNDSQAEFESSIRIMTQLFVDALNEREIQKRLPDRIDNEKGISKFKRWMEQQGYPHAERDTQFLRNLQEIRSKATAHRKSSDYEKTLTRVFGDLRGPAAVKTFFTSALSMLTGLSEWASEPKPPQE